MRNKLTKITQAAGFALALAFTFSCHDGGGNEDGTSSSDTKISSSGNTGGKQSSSSEIAVTPSSSGKSSSGGVASGDTSGTFKDIRDGQTYKWVKIGTQIWMAQNLNYFEPWVGITRGNKCYDNKDANCEKYGRLYEWDDAIRVCPDGWHLPTQSEWNTLVSTVGSDAGTKLKSVDDWNNGTDIYDFEALPGGGLDGGFKNINVSGNWWTSTESNVSKAYMKYMNSSNNVGELSLDKTLQYSIRCIYGNSSSSSITYGEVTDKRDNQKYKTIKIGTQTWMAQNLNYAGTDPEIGLCYDNEIENCDIYGRLYDWASAMNISKDYNSVRLDSPSERHKGICPDGWHLASLDEWDALISFVGEAAGKKLKARSSEWEDNYGTDIYGFRALPNGGYDYDIGGFVNLNKHGNWWTSTESLRGDLDRAQMKSMNVDINETRMYGTKAKQYSVRCIED